MPTTAAALSMARASMDCASTSDETMASIMMDEREPLPSLTSAAMS